MKTKTPIIKECPVNIECKVVKILENMGTHTIFIGEVVVVHINQELEDKSIYAIEPLFYALKKPWHGKLTPLDQ